jgi:hypothetical protein
MHGEDRKAGNARKGVCGGIPDHLLRGEGIAQGRESRFMGIENDYRAVLLRKIGMTKEI